MQAAAQALVDSSISKTVNCPDDISFDEFADIYVEGYHLGCKGLTIYRPNPLPDRCSNYRQPRSSPVKWPPRLACGLRDTQRRRSRRRTSTVRDLRQLQKLGSLRLDPRSDLDDFGGFRRGGDIFFVPEELKAVFDPRGGAWMKGRYVPSLLAAIGEVIERRIGQHYWDVPRRTRPLRRPSSSPAVRNAGCRR